MYVYISETCQQEAKLYQIEQKLEELANWVKKGSRPDFFKLFEIFQHPYSLVFFYSSMFYQFIKTESEE